MSGTFGWLAMEQQIRDLKQRVEQAENERDQALAALRELVDAFGHWRATTVGFAGGNDTAERFAALEAEIESARDLLERLS